MSEDNTNYFESSIEGGAVVVSEVGPEDSEEVLDYARSTGLDPRAMRALASWAEDSNSGRRQNRGLFHRDKFVTPGKVFEQMAMAYDALDDDVVGNIADVSEAMALQRVNFETADDKDQENIWHQIGRDLDLDGFVRAMWRELFISSVCYPVKWYGIKEYKVKGKREAREARKKFTLRVPTALGFLDPTRVVPVDQDMFGNYQLAWIASESDLKMIDDQEVEDKFIEEMFLHRYVPSEKEKKDLAREDIDAEKLIILNPLHVWQQTLTKSPFERWPRNRMKSVFPLLDLKHQLREMDRAFLLGGINFIVLVTRGSDAIPTTKSEVDNTTAQVRAQSKSPIIVSDHRIDIKIITPDIDHVLDADKWDTIDQRLLMRLWGTFMLPGDQGNRETSMTMGRVIARGLASRRHMMKRGIEKFVIRTVIEDPFNKEAGFDAETAIEFAPRRMELEFDATVVSMIQSLRDRGDMSRETVLTEFGFDQELEASRREYEDERYDGTFDPVEVPFDSPNRAAGNPDQSGRTGGQPAGQKKTKKESDE